MGQKSLAEHLGAQTKQRIAEAQGEPLPPPTPIQSAEAFCRDFLDSQHYRDSLYRRVLMDDLAPAIECMIWDRAFGQVPKKLEVRNTTNQLEEMSIEQLEERAMFLASVARRLREKKSDEGETESSASVH